MTDATEKASQAGRALAAQRWRTTRIDRLLAELHDRANQLGDSQLSRLQRLLDEAGRSAGSTALPGGEAA
jgi:hypothetical protein